MGAIALNPLLPTAGALVKHVTNTIDRLLCLGLVRRLGNCIFTTKIVFHASVKAYNSKIYGHEIHGPSMSTALHAGLPQTSRAPGGCRVVFDVGPAVDASQQSICLPENGGRLRNLPHLLQDSDFNQ